MVIAFLLLEIHHHLAPAASPHAQVEMELLTDGAMLLEEGRWRLHSLDQLRNCLLGPGRAREGSTSCTASSHSGQPGEEKAPRPWYTLPMPHTFTSLTPLPELSLPLPPLLHTLREQLILLQFF